MDEIVANLNAKVTYIHSLVSPEYLPYLNIAGSAVLGWLVVTTITQVRHPYNDAHTRNAHVSQFNDKLNLILSSMCNRRVKSRITIIYRILYIFFLYVYYTREDCRAIKIIYIYIHRQTKGKSSVDLTKNWILHFLRLSAS